MKTTLFTLIIFLNSILYSQSKSLDSLNIELKNIEDKISILNSLKQNVQNQINFINFRNKQLDTLNKNDLGIVAFSSYLGTNLYEKPNSNSKKIFEIPFKDSTLVLSRHKKTIWLKTKYKNVIGYVSYNSLKKTDALLSIYDTEMANRLEMLIKRFGRKNALGILNKRYWTGMSKDMAEESLGKPNTKNKSTGSWGIHEQWVYSNINNKRIYLYFENNKLTSFQN